MLTAVVKQFAERLTVVFDRLQLDAGLLGLILVHKKILVQLLRQTGVVGNHNLLLDQIVHGKKQQRHGR